MQCVWRPEGGAVQSYKMASDLGREGGGDDGRDRTAIKRLPSVLLIDLNT